MKKRKPRAPDGLIAFHDASTPSGAKNSREDDEPHREAIDAEVIADGGVGDPVAVLIELEEARGPIVEMRRQMQCEQQREQRDDERDNVVQLRTFLTVRNQRNDDCACERREEKQREDGMIEIHRVSELAFAGWTTKRTMAMTTAAPSASQPA